MLYKMLVPFILVLSFTAAAWSDDAKDESLQGTWLPASAEIAGNKFPDKVLMSMKLVIKDDTYALTVEKEGTDEGTIKLMPSVNPKAMDITGTKGPNKGKPIPAIYEQKGDTLKICYDLSGKQRPTEFKAKAGTLHFLVEYKRQKQ